MGGRIAVNKGEMKVNGADIEWEYLITAWIFGMVVVFAIRQIVVFTVRNIAYFPESPPERDFSIKREVTWAAIWALIGVVVLVLWNINFFESLYVKFRLFMLDQRA